MNTVKTAIIGIGNMGTEHARQIYSGSIPELSLTALCDPDPARLEYCRENFKGVPCFSDYKELIAGSDAQAVIIAVPHRLHSEISLAALEAGLHVLCEKPIDITVSRARRLNEAAERSGRVFGIMFNQRTNGLFKKARELVNSGELGELKRSIWIITNWYRTQHYYDSGDWRATWAGEGGGVLLNQAPHNLDIWQWICGMPTSITAFCDTAKYHRIEVEDDVTLFARYKNGATGVFITTTGEYPGTNRLEISGEKGKMVLENGILKLWRLKESEKEIRFASKENFAQPETVYSEYKPSGPEEAHAGILKNFAAAILRGEPLLAPGIDGIKELTVSNAAYLSQWQGNRVVDIPFDEQEFDRELKKRISASSFDPSRSSKRVQSSDPARWQVRW